MFYVNHIVARIDKKASGLSSAIPRICRALHDQGQATKLHVTHKAPKDSPFQIVSYPHRRFLDNIGISPMMYKSLLDLDKKANILHNHSLWTMPNLYAGKVAMKSDTRMVFSPHGTLSSWALNHSKYKKRLFWRLGQRYALKYANCFHATAESEYEDIRRLGFKQPIAIIPLGIDLPNVNTRINRILPPYKLLFMARLHPKKGVDLLINSWHNIQDKFPNWELVIAGPEDYPGYAKNLEQLVQTTKCNRVKFIGPVYGPEKDKILWEASLYALPTHSENFGITVAEALAAETPVIVTKGAPWSGIEAQGCGWWIERDKTTLENTLNHAMSLSEDQRLAMGKRGKEWIQGQFSWEKMARELISTYQWISGDSIKPGCIKSD